MKWRQTQKSSLRHIAHQGILLLTSTSKSIYFIGEACLFTQFSVLIFSILSNSLIFSVTIVKLFSIAVQPISRSKSLITFPNFCNLTFSLPYIGIASKIGKMLSWLISCSIKLWFFIGLALFSAPKTSSANVISEIAQFSNPTLSSLSIIPYFPRKKWIQIFESSKYFISRSERFSQLLNF